MKIVRIKLANGTWQDCSIFMSAYRCELLRAELARVYIVAIFDK